MSNNHLFNLPDEIQQKIYYEEHKSKMIPIMANINNLLNGFCDIIHNPVKYTEKRYDWDNDILVRVRLDEGRNWKKSYYRRYHEERDEYILILGDGWDNKTVCGEKFDWKITATFGGMFGYRKKELWWHQVRPSVLHYDFGSIVSDNLTKDDIRIHLHNNDIKYKSKLNKNQLIKLMFSF